MATLPDLILASPLDASDDSRHSHTAGTENDDITYAMPTLPADFGTMDTLSWVFEYRQQGRVDDTLGLQVRIVNGATILAAANSGGTFATVANPITTTTDTTSSVTAFGYINTTADKTTWQNATIEIRQRYIASKANDGGHVEVDFAKFTSGTYTPGATALLADDISSAASVTTPALGQTHGLNASDLSSSTSVSSPAVGQAHALHADDVSSASSATTPSLSEAHALLADDVSSVSSVDYW